MPALDSNWKKALFFCACWMLFFGLGILVRLPHFLSKNFFFDGDEAIIGIMAQDFLDGKHFPLYFYGQNYGFSMFEALSTALFVKLAGSGIWALRLGGLLIFSLGVTFLFQTAQNRNAGHWRSWLLAILVLSFPAWYLWGGMVRGGYVTAFTLCCALFYIVHGTRFSLPKLVMASILAGFAFECHVLILIPMAPFVACWLLKQEKWLAKAGLFIAVLAITVILIRWAGYTDAKWPKPALEFGLGKQLSYFALQTDGFLSGYSNFFFFTRLVEIPAWWHFLLIASLFIATGLLLADLVKSGRLRKLYYFFFAFSLLVSCFLISTVSSAVPRYWIGCCTGILFALLFVFITRKSRLFNAGLILLTLICLAGTASGSKMENDSSNNGVNEMLAFEGWHREVAKHHPKGIFITDNLLQYQWNYLYGKEIPASAFRPEERTNAFRSKVDSLYNVDPAQTIIGGKIDVFLYMDTIRGFNDSRVQVENKYFLNYKALPAFVAQGKRTMCGL